MKLKTTLYVALLSFTSISMIACNNSESSRSSAKSALTVDQSLEGQLKVVETEILELESKKSRLEYGERENQVSGYYDAADKAELKHKMLNAEMEEIALAYDTAVKSGASMSPGHPLAKQLAVIDQKLADAKEESDQLSSNRAALASDLQNLNNELTDKVRTRDTLNAKIRIKSFNKAIETASKPDADSFRMLILKDESLIKKIQAEIDEENLINEI